MLLFWTRSMVNNCILKCFPLCPSTSLSPPPTHPLPEGIHTIFWDYFPSSSRKCLLVGRREEGNTLESILPRNTRAGVERRWRYKSSVKTLKGCRLPKLAKALPSPKGCHAPIPMTDFRFYFQHLLSGFGIQKVLLCTSFHMRGFFKIITFISWYKSNLPCSIFATRYHNQAFASKSTSLQCYLRQVSYSGKGVSKWL